MVVPPAGVVVTVAGKVGTTWSPAGMVTVTEPSTVPGPLFMTATHQSAASPVTWSPVAPQSPPGLSGEIERLVAGAAEATAGASGTASIASAAAVSPRRVTDR